MSVNLPLGWTLRSYETVTSTMDEARLHLDDQCVILANRQTQGRGRHQRRWISESGNLFCSLVIRPQKPQKNWPELTFVTALAVGETIDRFLPNCDFLTYKWPNDILLKSRKVSGILLEVHEDFMIIGIAMNLISCPKTDNYFPTRLADFCSVVPSALEVLSIFIVKFQNLWHLWQSKGFHDIREKWLKQAAFKDQEIKLKAFSSDCNPDIQGEFQGIDHQGNLILRLSNGVLKSYSAGDVSLVLKEKLE